MLIGANTVTVTNPAGEVLFSMPAVAIVDRKNRIRAFGETPEELEKQYPLKWAKEKDTFLVRTPLSITDFDPLLATYLIHYAAYMATCAAPGKPKFSMLKPSIALSIDFPGYEQLDQSHQHLLVSFIEYAQIFVRITDLVINLSPRPVKEIRLARYLFTYGNLATGSVSFFVGFYLLYRLLLANILHVNMNLWSSLVLIGVLITLGLFLLYLPVFLLSFLWKRAFKRYFPDIISRSLMANAKFGLPGFLINILYPQETD